MYACYVWKQWEIWLQNCKIDTKTMQCMWILNINDAWKEIGQIPKNSKKFSFDWSSIDRIPIESGRIKPKFVSQFRSVKQQVQSIENLEKSVFFEKQSTLMQKLLKAHCIMNKMHEYEMKSFSKTLEFNPDLPKTRFSINMSLKLKH